jgi:magnesium-transporting ATPase (P-type)
MDIPVDGIIYHSSGVSISEAAMTGESDEMKKDSVEKCFQKREEKQAEMEFSKEKPNSHAVPSPVMLSGTQVATGEGWFVCTVVGDNSAIGQIMKNLEAEEEETPLQIKLEVIATDIGKLGMYAALLTVHVLYIRFFVEEFTARSMDFAADSLDYIREWLRYIVVGVTIVVVAVPEGLPLAVMISLAFSVKKMLIDQNFVKKLASCEIMGGANNICSDKTGTLTQNKMNVTDIWVGKECVLNTKENLEGVFKWEQVCNEGSKVKELLKQSLSCNTTGTVDDSSATEKAMLLFMKGVGEDIEAKRKQHLG